MDFSLSDEQQLLRETARNLLAKECPTSLLRAHIDDPSAAAPLWDSLRDFSALGNGPATDLVLFLEEMGYVAAPGPFFASVALFAPLLAALEHELLDAVLEGETTGTVALAGADGLWVVNDESVKTFVPEADRVDWIAVVSSGPTVSVVPAAQVQTRRVQTIDFSRRLFEVDAGDGLGNAQPIDASAFAGVVERGTVALSAELGGTARRLFDMALEYAKQRIQFDVPIGSFQAIQHRLADCSLGVERAQSAAQYAAMALDADDDDRLRAVHVAKAATGNAAKRAAKDSAQIHGGIGYTWEHDLHLFLRRAYGSEPWMGNTAWHHDRLAELLFGS